jgi:hypothetical protein
LGHAKRLTVAGRFQWIALEGNEEDVRRTHYQYIVRGKVAMADGGCMVVEWRAIPPVSPAVETLDRVFHDFLA